MKQKIFEALKTKFTGVDAQTLDRIASKKAEGVTDENQITSIVDGVSFQDVLQSYGDFRAGDASKSAVTNYEKKYNLKEGKTVDTPQPTPTPQPESKPDDTPAWAKALIEQNKSLSEKIASIEGKNAQDQRTAEIQEKAKEYGIDQKYVDRLAIKEDANLDEYFTDLKQDFANDGFNGSGVPDSSQGGVKGEAEAFANAIREQTKQIVKQEKN